jgi:hypothetical protein
LCNRPLRVTSDTPPRATPKTDDIDLQIEEAERILKDVRRESKEIQTSLETLRGQETKVSRDLDIESRLYVSPAVDRLLAQGREIAQRETELTQAQSLLGQARALEAIRSQLNELKKEQAKLEDQLREARKPYKIRLNKLREIYENILMAVEFPDFQSCSINSQTLIPNINGSLYIHTGTALKGLATVAYHLALLELSRKEETFFPRMLTIDSPAVGDLNNENHDKLLRYLAMLQSSIESDADDESKELDWQIILTTRRLIPDLEPYVIEEVSAPNRMLLRERE